MLIGEMQHDGPLSWSNEEMNAHKIMKHPPGGWILYTLPFLIGKRRVMPLKRLTNAVLQGRIHQSTHGHDHQEGHDPLGFFEVERGGQT
jgi:hypothetical protein